MAAPGALLPCALLLVALQISLACDHCSRRNVVGASSRRAMLSAHGPECSPQSGATPAEVLALEQGPPPAPTPAQRRHVYCVLRRCDMIAVDGRPLQNHQAATKCGYEESDSPEDRALKVFYCGCGETTTAPQTTASDSPQPTAAATPQRTLTDAPRPATANASSVDLSFRLNDTNVLSTPSI